MQKTKFRQKKFPTRKQLWSAASFRQSTRLRTSCDLLVQSMRPIPLSSSLSRRNSVRKKFRTRNFFIRM